MARKDGRSFPQFRESLSHMRTRVEEKESQAQYLELYFDDSSSDWNYARKDGRERKALASLRSTILTHARLCAH